MIFECPVGQKKCPNSTEMYPVLFARIPSTFLQSLSQEFQCSRNTLVSLVNLLEPQHCVFCKSNLVSFAPVFPEVSLKSRVLWRVLTSICVSPADIPKLMTNHTVYYSWEGNPVNISCDVMSNPPATMLWKRERFTISAEATANTRVHTAPGKSVLEVGPVQRVTQ